MKGALVPAAGRQSSLHPIGRKAATIPMSVKPMAYLSDRVHCQDRDDAVIMATGSRWVLR